MMAYYYAIVFITIAMMAASIIHLFENETLSRRINSQLILVAALISIGVICEFLGLFFNGTSVCPKYVHGIIKAIEYSVTPIIPICYVRIIKNKKFGKMAKITSAILILNNMLCEIVSVFIPFVFYIDNSNIYRHGMFYPIYMISYFIGIVVFIIVLLKDTRKYQSRNIASLISLLSFMVLGFAIRLYNNSIYTDWLVGGITYLLFIIYYSDVSLKVDALTHVFNRKSYENRLKSIDYATAIIVLDINEFKQINDNYGHQCGDNVLKVIAKALLKAYGKYGYCYRIGGDEFCVILKPGKVDDLEAESANSSVTDVIDKLNELFDKNIEEQLETYPMLKSGVAKGYAIFNGRVNQDFQSDEKSHYTLSSLKETIKLADDRMYEDKRKTKEIQN